MPRKNIISAAGFLAFAAIYGYLTTGLIERTLPNTPGPSFFPWLLTGGFAVLAASLLIQGLLAQKTDEPPEKDGGKSIQVSLTGLGLFAVYLAALPYLGFLVGSIPFFAGLMLISGERRTPLIAAATLIIPVFLFFLFQDGFQILLPRGSVMDW